MTTIKTFLKSKKDDMFRHLDTIDEYTKEDLDFIFQDYQGVGFVTIQEYYENLTNFLKEFRKISN